MFVAPGAPVDLTLRLFSAGSLPISGSLELCLPALLTNVSGGTLAGTGPIPPPQSFTCSAGGSGFRWDDLLCYAAGVLLATVVDKRWLRARYDRRAHGR